MGQGRLQATMVMGHGTSGNEGDGTGMASSSDGGGAGAFSGSDGDGTRAVSGSDGGGVSCLSTAMTMSIGGFRRAGVAPGSHNGGEEINSSSDDGEVERQAAKVMGQRRL